MQVLPKFMQHIKKNTWQMMRSMQLLYIQSRAWFKQCNAYNFKVRPWTFQRYLTEVRTKYVFFRITNATEQWPDKKKNEGKALQLTTPVSNDSKKHWLHWCDTQHAISHYIYSWHIFRPVTGVSTDQTSCVVVPL